MKIFCFVDGRLNNFGDDLNRWMWGKILGRSLDTDDGTLVLAIGTVISREVIPPAKRYIVLSSGVGYGAPPVNFGGPEWEILSVRGPLTAKVLGLPPEKAIVDGAALLRLLPECTPLPASERDGIVFMPHYESLHTGNWKEACEMAGFGFLDPHTDSEQTVQRIRRARLVIADAMHAAIVADTLRVPWVPVATSPQINSFKWLDWTLSLDLPYNPTPLPASTLLESVRGSSFRFYGEKFYLEDRTPENALRHYRRMRKIKSWKYTPQCRLRLVQLTYSVPKKVVTSPVLRRFKKQQDQNRTHRAAEHLLRTAKLPSYLSGENIFRSRFDRITHLLQKLYC